MGAWLIVELHQVVQHADDLANAPAITQAGLTEKNVEGIRIAVAPVVGTSRVTIGSRADSPGSRLRDRRG